jgi:teichuronic acid biosynthesis glycosyltransferase TuaC
LKKEESLTKILFIYSGNSESGISPVIRNQAESLRKAGVEIDLFPLRGKGSFGYLKNVYPLKKKLNSNKYDVIHAHYSFSGFAASFAGAKPLIVSLMGSDIHLNKIYLEIIKTFQRLFKWKIIVKAANMNPLSRIRNVEVIPNGVDLNLFKPIDRIKCLNKLNWENTSSHILFAGDPGRPEKNFTLLKEGLTLINHIKLNLHLLGTVPNEDMPLWYNAADLVVLTSLWEGSPNVIKEAMACNCPIVATNVGDIAWLLGNEPGHFIAAFHPVDVAEKLKMALKFSRERGRTNGRNRITSLGLDSVSVASRIIEVYKSLCSN